jgi:uncharacterized protein YacL
MRVQGIDFVSVCPFVLFALAIVLSVLLRYTNSDYPFGIFEPLLQIFLIKKKNNKKQNKNTTSEQYQNIIDGDKIDTLNTQFEDTKGVIRIRISKKNRQHNGQSKKYKRTNSDLQKIHI